VRRAEPRFGERVPYVVVCGEPGARLYDCVVPPRALVEGGRGGARLNALYYIAKAILPALDRILSLVGADCKVGGAAVGWKWGGPRGGGERMRVYV
jgi:DNA polymerase zeta